MVFPILDIVISPYEESMYKLEQLLPRVILIVAIIIFILSVFFIVRKIKSNTKKSAPPENTLTQSHDASDK